MNSRIFAVKNFEQKILGKKNFMQYGLMVNLPMSLPISLMVKKSRLALGLMFCVLLQVWSSQALAQFDDLDVEASAAKADSEGALADAEEAKFKAIDEKKKAEAAKKLSNKEAEEARRVEKDAKAKMQIWNQEREVSQRERAESEKRIELAKVKQDSLRKLVDEEKRKIEMERAATEKSIAERDALEAEIERTEDTLQTLKNDHRKLVSELEKLKGDVAKKRVKLDNSHAQLETTKRNNSKEIERVKNELAKNDLEIQGLLKSSTGIKSRLRSFTQKNSTALAQGNLTNPSSSANGTDSLAASRAVASESSSAGTNASGREQVTESISARVHDPSVENSTEKRADKKMEKAPDLGGVKKVETTAARREGWVKIYKDCHSQASTASREVAQSGPIVKAGARLHVTLIDATWMEYEEAGNKRFLLVECARQPK